MFLFGYRCTDCHRAVRRNERVVTEGPFGPEPLCPHCQGVVTLRAHRLLIVLYAVLVGIAAISYGCWSSAMRGLSP
jgi:NAD-dependent SIR2 family protein deacetylase